MKKTSPLIKSIALAAVSGAVLGLASLNDFSVNTSHAACSSSAGPGVDWEDCRKRNLIMTEFDFTGSNISRADLSSSDLRGSVFDKSDLSKSNLVRASLAGAKARDVNFTRAIAYRTNFSSGDYTGSNFGKAEIIRADFSKSVLLNIDMSKGEFSRVNFSNAQIGNINFDSSNLARSDFRGTEISDSLSMKGAFLFRTRFEGVDLSRINGLETWQLEMSCGNASTVLPEGMERPPNWPCVEETE